MITKKNYTFSMLLLSYLSLGSNDLVYKNQLKCINPTLAESRSVLLKECANLI